MIIDPKRLGSLNSEFTRVFGRSSSFVARGPGRVDLMGIHTDYNQGFVLPIAVNLDVIAVAAPRDDGVVRLFSTNKNALSEFRVDSIPKDVEDPWANYPKGVLHFLRVAGAELGGADVAFHGTVPLGGGLSSSAALETATAAIFSAMYPHVLTGPQVARVCQLAENEFVGIGTGIMDQFASLLCAEDHALFLDCRTLEYELVPLDTSVVKIVVMDTRKARGLVDSEYDTRRSQCEVAAREFAKWIPGVTALRDVSPEHYERFADRLDPVVAKRARHVVYENDRVVRSKEALKNSDYTAFGKLMNASHDSARDYYEVSCPELEAMVLAARQAPGALSGRLAGAGFGGCAVALVESGAVEEFLAYVSKSYRQATGLDPNLYVCTAADGARARKEPMGSDTGGVD